MFTDNVSDFVTRIRNATTAGKETLEVRNSKIVASIADLLKKSGYLESVVPEGRVLTINLNPQMPVTEIRRMSKPGLRTYVKASEVPRTRSGLGMVILTTPKGVMSGNQAKKQKVGGELICEIW